MAILYMLATPIGNLKDISLRALEILRESDLIVCEDTRHSRKLLSAYDIHKPLISAHGYNEESAAERVVAALAEGRTVVYVSDAGTPGLSDPGAILCRTARRAGYPVVPIPGPSAFAAAVSVGGFSGKTVVFEGFLSPKGGKRRSRLRELLAYGFSFVIYESPFRVLKLLADIAEIAPDRTILLAREMTKVHEEYLEGTADELRAGLASRDVQKGEFTLLIGPYVRGGDVEG